MRRRVRPKGDRPLAMPFSLLPVRPEDLHPGDEFVSVTDMSWAPLDDRVKIFAGLRPPGDIDDAAFVVHGNTADRVRPERYFFRVSRIVDAQD